MNALDIMKYGNLTLLGTIADLPEDKWMVDGVCGWWSVRHIIAHLASYECVLEEVLTGYLDSNVPHPNLDEYKSGADFNDNQVNRREGYSPKQALDEYNETHQRVMQLAKRIPRETYEKVGTLPWYGEEYALDDYIVYAYYGHKREHSAQINVFKDTLKLA